MARPRSRSRWRSGFGPRGEDPVAISADAFQVYRGLELLSGAADAPSRRDLEHRLLSFVPLDQTFSAGAFSELARAEMDGALAGGRRPLVVGGTGLYLQAALTDLELRPPPTTQVRSAAGGGPGGRGSAALHADLAARDERPPRGSSPATVPGCCERSS